MRRRGGEQNPKEAPSDPGSCKPPQLLLADENKAFLSRLIIIKITCLDKKNIFLYFEPLKFPNPHI